MLSKLTRPVILAHRGASAHAPENTLAAFQLAVKMGVSAIELDVQLTADHEVVVFHDSDLDRITDGSGILSTYTLRELQQLTIRNPFQYADVAIKIPTLSEVLSNLPPDILVNIELKNLLFPFDRLPEKTSQIIEAFSAQDRVLISSFNPKALKRFKKIMPDIPCGRLLHNPMMIQLYRLLSPLSSGYYSVHLPYQVLTRALVRQFQDREVKVLAYTVNSQQDILNIASLGVDGFFTDDPALAQKLLCSTAEYTAG